MKVIYIAGKYRGPNAWAVEQNIRADEDVAARVWAMGVGVRAQGDEARHMDGVASDEHFLAGTLELMRRCDAVVLVPNWRDSEGARAEVAEAERLGLPMFGKHCDGDDEDDRRYLQFVAMHRLSAWSRGETLPDNDYDAVIHDAYKLTL